MSFLYENDSTFLLDQTKHPLYYNKRPHDIPSLFSQTQKNKPQSLYNNDKDILVFNTVSSSSDDEDCNDMGLFFNPVAGAKKISNKPSTIQKKSLFLNTMPTFINVLKGRVLYNNSTKFSLEKILPQSNNVVLGTIIDLFKVKKEIHKDDISKDDIIKYVERYDVVPLLFDFNSRNIIYKNKKNNFFSKDSKLIFITFDMVKKHNYYCESPTKTTYDTYQNIDKVLSEKDYIIGHYIYENYYFFVTNPKINLKIKKGYYINIDNQNDLFQEIDWKKPLQYNNNNRKINLVEMTEILNKATKSLTKFL